MNRLRFPDRVSKALKQLPQKNLQEQVSRIGSLIEWNEQTGLCKGLKVNWETPTQEYYTQELVELPMSGFRFSKNEFFHPKNYDLTYSLFPHTFKKIAEHLSEIRNIPLSSESKEEIKKILLNKDVQTLMDDWNKYSHMLAEDPEVQKEAFDFFDMGKLKVWKGTDPETGEYVDNTDNTFYMEKVRGSRLKIWDEWHEKWSSSHHKCSHCLYRGYIYNLETYMEFAKRGEEISMPAPFVIKLPVSPEQKEYNLIGGHKRSVTALQLGIEPIKVWLIDLTN